MKIRNPRIAFIGDLTVDRYVDKGEIKLGGAALNGALWAKRVGAHASVVTAVGTDDAGVQFHQLFKRQGIDASHVSTASGHTLSVEIHIDAHGEKRYGVWNPVLLANYHLKKPDIRFLKKHDAIVVTVYPQYLHVLDELRMVRSPRRKKPLVAVNYGDLGEFGSDIRVATEYVSLPDILVFGLDKDKDEMHINALRQLAREWGKTVLITLGAFGSLVYEGDDVYMQPARVIPVVDSTGAGDAFLAAYMTQYLRSGDIQKSLIAGTNTASKVLSHVGAY